MSSDGPTAYAELAKLAADAGLGSDLVVQTPYGDSGKTTFFIKEERDWRRNAEHMVGEELKIMKRINNRAAAVEAVNTRHGTVVGPFMTDSDRLSRTHAVQGWLVRQRPVPGGAERGAPGRRDRARPPARRPVAAGGL